MNLKDSLTFPISLFLIIFSYTSLAQDDNKDIYRAIVSADTSYLKGYKFKNVCLVNVYLKSIELKQIEKCNVESVTSKYLYLQSLYFKNTFLFEYESALSNAKDILALINSNPDKFYMFESLKNEALQNIEKLKVLSDKKLIYRKPENLNIPSSFEYSFGGKKYLIDTAAMFSTTDFSLEEKIGDLSVRSFTGAVNNFPYTFREEPSPTLFIKDSLNILGQQFYSQYNKIVLKENFSYGKDSVSNDLYFDTGNLFYVENNFLADLTVKDVNVCIDSGAEITILDSPTLLKSLAVSRSSYKYMNFTSASGKATIRTASIDGFRLSEHHTIDLRAIVDTEVNPICDVILGRDFLSDYLQEISIQDMKVTFSI